MAMRACERKVIIGESDYRLTQKAEPKPEGKRAVWASGPVKCTFV